MSAKKGKKKWIIIIVAVVLVIALIVGLAVAGAGKKQEQTTKGTVELITKRTIANSITANGMIEAANTENVTGGSYGMKVESVKVKAGEVVAVGDVICIFNTDDLDEQIKTVQDNIADAKEDKQTQLADYDKQIADRKAENAEDLAEAKENLAEAEAKLAEEKAELAKWEKEYADGIANNTLSVSDKVDLVSTINSQKTTVDNAQNRVDNYKSRVESLEDADTSNLEDAKENYAEQMDNTIDNYEDRLESLQEQKEDCTIRAGISGVVTAVNVTEGSNFNGGTIASIEGVDRFIVEAQVEEYDVADIAVGMKVLVKTDATRDAELEGIITYVAPRATNSGSSSMSGFSSLMGGMDTSSLSGSGSATYLVKIELKEQNDRLRLGMNAKTSIITEESVDVWSVPYDAIYTRTDGTTYVEEVTGKDEDGNYVTKELDVTVGLQGTYYVEIISDKVSEETEILVPDAQGNSSIEELLNMMGAGAGI
ncbi:MAG: efflux RND transporter periplasmic adaptor subunit [Agathobacter sp.]|nr:efflux RND transporter periplasmic adaptor subunit [Agathobacter sp.]